MKYIFKLCYIQLMKLIDLLNIINSNTNLKCPWKVVANENSTSQSYQSNPVTGGPVHNIRRLPVDRVRRRTPQQAVRTPPDLDVSSRATLRSCENCSIARARALVCPDVMFCGTTEVQMRREWTARCRRGRPLTSVSRWDQAATDTNVCTRRALLFSSSPRVSDAIAK